MSQMTDSYTLKFLDQITAPLKSLERQMGSVVNLMTRMEKMTGQGLGLLKVGGAAVAAVGALKLVGAAIGGVVGLFEQGIQIGAGFVRTLIEVTRFRTSAITSLSTFLGKGTGEKTFLRALDIGGITPADELQVVEQVKQLAAAGYKGGGLSRANAALLDVQAMFGNEQADQLRYYFRKFYGGRKVEADDFRMAAFAGGMQENDLMRRVIRLTGGTPKDSNVAMGKQFDALKKAGKITGQDVVKALFEGINERLSEGQGLGSAARKMGEGTLSGLISNLEAAPKRFLAQMSLEKMEGIQSLMEFLKRLLVFFDHSTPQGKQLAQVVERITNALFGGLDRITANDLANFFQRAVKVANQLVEVIKSAWQVMDQLLRGDTSALVAAAGEALIQVGKFIGMGIWEGFKLAMRGGQVEAERDRLKKMGLSDQSVEMAVGWQANAGRAAFAAQARSTGAAAGLDTSSFGGKVLSMPKLEEAGADLAAGAEEGLRRKAESHSPSELMARAGEDLVDGLVVGITRRTRVMSDGGGAGDALLDELVHLLRGAAQRRGMAVAR